MGGLLRLLLLQFREAAGTQWKVVWVTSKRHLLSARLSFPEHRGDTSVSWTLEKTTGSTSSSSHAPCLFDLIFQLIVWRLKVSTELDREEKRQRVYMGEGSMLRRHLSGWAKCLRSRKTLWKVGTWCFWQGQALFGARWNSWVSWIHTRNWVKIKSHSGYQTCRGYRETHLGYFKTPLRVLYKCSFIYST